MIKMFLYLFNGVLYPLYMSSQNTCSNCATVFSCFTSEALLIHISSEHSDAGLNSHQLIVTELYGMSSLKVIHSG